MNYIIAVFSSRSHTMLFYNRLKAQNKPCSIINNPKATKTVCGICVKFYSNSLSTARAILNNSLTDFVGFFKLTESFGKFTVSPLK